MNRDIAQGEWKQLSGKIKQKWGKLTDDDLTRAKGDRDYLVGRLHEQYGIARDKVEDELETLGYSEDDQDVDLRSSDRSAAGRMDATGYADAGSSNLRGGARDSEQGGNLDREDPSGRNIGSGSTSNRGNPSQKAGGAGQRLGDESNEEQNPSMSVRSPQQPGGAGHTLEAGSTQGSSGQQRQPGSAKQGQGSNPSGSQQKGSSPQKHGQAGQGSNNR